MLRFSYYSARLGNQLGQALFFAGLFWFVGGAQGAAVGASSLMVAMMAGSIALGLVGGALADAIGAARATVLGAGARASVILATLLCATGVVGVPAFVAGPVLAFTYSGVSQLYCPAELALVRAVVPDRPSAGHAMLVVLQYAGQGLALGVAALLALAYQAPAALLLAGALSYGGVVALALVVSSLAGPVPRAGRMRAGFAFASTVRLFLRHPGATYASVLLAFSELAAKALIVAVPYYLAHELRLSHAAMIALAIPAAAGLLGGLGWASRSFHHGIARPVLRLTLLATVVSLFALAVLGDGLAAMSRELGLWAPFGDESILEIAVTVPVALLLGACFAVGPVSARAVLSAAAPRRQQARVFAVQGTLTDVVAILPLALAGAGVQASGTLPTFLFLGVLGAAAFAVLEVTTARLPAAASSGITVVA